LVIPVIVIEASTPGEPWETMAAVLNWTIWMAFLAEAAIMLAVVPNRRFWLRHHPLEVLIVVGTAPFYPPSLQSARILRLLRVLRLLRGVRAARNLFSTEGLKYAAIIAVFVVLGGGAAYAAVERGHQNLNAWDGVWWAITTVTAIGFGPYEPKTHGGRAIEVAVILVGIGFVALLTAAAAQRFISPSAQEAEAEFDEKEQQVIARLDDIAARLERLEQRHE
jgi:voltage-gated potassium channel